MELPQVFKTTCVNCLALVVLLVASVSCAGDLIIPQPSGDVSVVVYREGRLFLEKTVQLDGQHNSKFQQELDDIITKIKYKPSRVTYVPSILIQYEGVRFNVMSDQTVVLSLYVDGIWEQYSGRAVYSKTNFPHSTFLKVVGGE